MQTAIDCNSKPVVIHLKNKLNILIKEKNLSFYGLGLEHCLTLAIMLENPYPKGIDCQIIAWLKLNTNYASLLQDGGMRFIIRDQSV